ncbi:NlpC/P60 family protein [Brevibacillus ginsengisoli]|uniref:C40 family peptidase n=1 Tax=Brevibacillus ginsengisoli TaxID=363854 RepID=UPI003CECFEE2
MSEQIILKQVHVAVATLWTTPESPEALDLPAITSPVDIRQWLTMSVEDRLALHDKDKDQTQVLFGSVVEVLREEGDWSYVLVPDQPTIKNDRGYPGWIPSCQLSSYEAGTKHSNYMVVSVPITVLYHADLTEDIEISYNTQLPVIRMSSDYAEVITPLGIRKIKADDVKFIENEVPKGNGDTIIREAQRFLGLPYLWGGTSAFGYDCSGFAFSMHLANGITIPRDASNQAKAGKLVEPADLLPGDLVFFAFEEGKGRVHHVGIYFGDGKMIHAPSTGKEVEIIPIKGSKYEVEHCISRRYWE